MLNFQCIQCFIFVCNSNWKKAIIFFCQYEEKLFLTLALKLDSFLHTKYMKPNKIHEFNQFEVDCQFEQKKNLLYSQRRLFLFLLPKCIAHGGKEK